MSGAERQLMMHANGKVDVNSYEKKKNFRWWPT